MEPACQLQERSARQDTSDKVEGLSAAVEIMLVGNGRPYPSLLIEGLGAADDQSTFLEAYRAHAPTINAGFAAYSHFKPELFCFLTGDERLPRTVKSKTCISLYFRPVSHCHFEQIPSTARKQNQTFRSAWTLFTAAILNNTTDLIVYSSIIPRNHLHRSSLKLALAVVELNPGPESLTFAAVTGCDTTFLCLSPSHTL